MGLFDTVTNAASTPIVPQDRFIFECVAIGEQPPYAPPGETPKPGARPGIKWELHLYYASNGEPFYFQDEQYVFYQSTTANMQRGARAREYAEALLGRELGEGEQINPSDLIGKRAQGMVIHELSRNDKTKKQAKLVAPEPLSIGAAVAVSRSAPGAGRVAQHVAASGAATAVAERPTRVSDGDPDWALLLSSVSKKVQQAEKLQTKKHLDWLTLDLMNMDSDELEAIKAAVQADIDAD